MMRTKGPGLTSGGVKLGSKGIRGVLRGMYMGMGEVD